MADVDGRKSQNQGAAGTLQAMVQRCTVTNGTQPIELILLLVGKPEAAEHFGSVQEGIGGEE